jgi:hypothetical protein
VSLSDLTDDVFLKKLVKRVKQSLVSLLNQVEEAHEQLVRYELLGIEAWKRAQSGKSLPATVFYPASRTSPQRPRLLASSCRQT